MTEIRAVLPDISEWNGWPFDFVRMKAQGVVAVGIRIGWLRPDKLQAQYRKAAREAGLLRFYYQYLDWRGSISNQIAQYNDLIKDDLPELGNYADVEMDPIHTELSMTKVANEYIDMMPFTRNDIGLPIIPKRYETITDSQKLMLSPNQVSGLTWNFLEAVKDPGIYTGYYYFNTWFKPDPAWAQFKLWEPWYAPESQVKVPKPWIQWDKWQYNGKGDAQLYGGPLPNKEIDLSLSRYTSNQILEMAGLVKPSVLPNEGFDIRKQHN